ncbi:chitobiase/beta-hexosaminidase C-terminal domain-containing protein [Belliella sp. R4-6]|uniref:Chitobiase/beta-hexosaminidase C-terminal domain-containing protein n=1 Tax=Belliella alkalica TaxID=1730871 RepID=A0ABS9VBX9_9BACT|nr:chitobiase/beta-hexosaminidase C-terminal domain-containing protein [Belliella alkalica]MCH7413947.1 chitobiase/beta-hexosaminidase C-terminal domain-containing protein [Belliella alkalica]
MKQSLQKTLLFAWLFMGIFALNAQTVSIAGWTFGTVAGEESTLADQGNSNNLGVQQISLVGANPSGYIAGSPGRAITSNSWASTAPENYWQFTLNTIGFENLAISLKQRSSNTGPRDFQLQYSLDGNTWINVNSGTITVGNNFTSGVLNNLSLPSALNNSPLIYIRSLLVSDVSVNGGTIANTGTSAIDEIFITGTASSSEPLPLAATPQINPAGGTFVEAQSVTLTTATEDATIYFTLDGSIPNLGSQQYNAPLLIEESTVISAIAFKEGFDVSEIASATFTISLPQIPASSIPYSQDFTQFVSLSNPVTSFGADDEWSFEGGALNYNGVFGAGTAGGFRGVDVLGYQHTGSSGTLEARLSLKNTTGSVITELEISYDGKAGRIDQTRFPEWTVSIDGVEFAELSYSTADGIDKSVSALISGLNILPEEIFNLTWSSDRGFNAGGGSRQIGLTNLEISVPVSLDPIEFVNWDFTGQPGNQVFTEGNTLAPGVLAGNFGRGTGINPTSAGNSISSNGWNTGENRYFSFGFTVAPDKLVDLSALQLGSTSSNTGPRDLALVYSGDGYTSRLAEWTHTGSFVNQIIDLSGLQNLSGEVEFRIISTSDVSANGGTVAAGGTLRVTNYFSSEGSLPVAFSGVIKDAAGVIIPTLTVDPNSIDFGIVSLADESPVLSYELSGSNLEGDVTISSSSPFSISKDGVAFASSLIFTSEELASSQTIFVKVDNSVEGVFNSSITQQTTGTLPVSLTVSASIFDPFNITEDFNASCPSLPSGWSAISVLGDQVWACTTFGRAGTTPTASAPSGLQINGFAGGAVLNEDWIITPSYDLTGFNIPLMSFWSRVAFQGPRLKLLISTDYENGNPNTATWTELSDRFANSDQWTYSGEIDLSAYLGQNIRIAFVYNSSPETGAARWTLDDFELFSSDIPASPFFTNSIGNVDYYHFGITAVSTASVITRTFNFSLSNAVDNLTISANEAFEFSKNGNDFSNSLTYTPEESANLNTVTIRFRPTQEGAFASPINFVSESGDINESRGYLTGATIEKDKTFDVVNWNVEWFGSSNSGQGPTNVDLQLQNVKTIIEDLDADVYAFQEITNLDKFYELADALPGYRGFNSPAVSQAGDFSQAQKLTYLYKTATVDSVTTRVLLQDVNPADLVGYPSGADRFWASGRLPYLFEIRTNINGVQKNINLINVHTRSNGGGESAANPRYAMRKYDVNVLKDSLDVYYKDVPLIILGDFNDDLDETVADQNAPTVNTSETSFINYINDSENYIPITISLSNAGLRTFPSFENVIDHQIISNELLVNWIVNSERIVAPYDLIPNFDNTTSDHLPIKTRFTFKCDLVSASIIASASEVCPGNNSVSFELSGGIYDSVVGWEISTDEGATWNLISGTAELLSITLEDIEENSLVRAILDSNICEPIATESVAVDITSLATPLIAFESSRLFTFSGGVSYVWFKNGKQVAVTTTNETRIQGAGTYTVIITDANGCSVESEPFSFPVKGNQNKIKVFPNPTNSFVNIELKRAEGLQNVELRSANGVLLQSMLTNGGTVQFDVSRAAKGVYLIVITDRFGNSTIERLIVR